MSSIGDELGKIWLELEAEGHKLASSVKNIVNELLGKEKVAVLDAEADAKKLVADGEADEAPVVAEAETDVKQVLTDAETDAKPLETEVKEDAASIEAEVVSGMTGSDSAPVNKTPPAAG